MQQLREESMCKWMGRSFLHRFLVVSTSASDRMQLCVLQHVRMEETAVHLECVTVQAPVTLAADVNSVLWL